MRVAVGLADGRTLTVETAGELTARIWGLPSGFFAGIAGFVVAALAVLLLVRETRPLARLSRSVERFAAALQPEPMPERGAPDVRTLIRAYNRMQSRIANLVRARTFVIGAISHDLRTYLTRLRLRVELLPEGFASIRHRRDRRHLAGFAPPDGTVHVFLVGNLELGGSRRADRSVRGLHWRYRGLLSKMRNREYLIVSNDAPATTFVHELGHLFGLEHDTSHQDLMCSCRQGPRQIFTLDEGRRMRSGALAFVARQR